MKSDSLLASCVELSISNYKDIYLTVFSSYHTHTPHTFMISGTACVRSVSDQLGMLLYRTVW